MSRKRHHTGVSMIEAVIFDVDGTRVDSVDFHAVAWEWAFTRFGDWLR